MNIIINRLKEKIKTGKKEKNYVGYFTNEEFLEELEEQNFNFVSLEANFYLYVNPLKASNRDKYLFQRFMNKR
jgi:hypothetical protein